MKNKKVLRIFSLLLALTLIAASFSSCSKDKKENDTTAPATEENTQNAPQSGNINLLTGEAVSADKAGQRTVALVVENSPQARPQWGINTPDITLEYEVEGGITRMLWLYYGADNIPDQAGPVRSARHDVVELALGLDAVFVHMGHSSFAKDKITEYSSVLTDIDGNYDYSCFFRDNSRNVDIEHTSCLKGSLLREKLAANGVRMTAAEGYNNIFSFAQSERVISDHACTKIDISYSDAYNYSFNYSDGLYYASLNGSERTDEKGEQCAYDNVIILYTDMVDMNTSSGHQDLKLENGGKGLYMNGGYYEQISWSKASDTAPLKLEGAGGELQLNTGRSYIGFVRSDRSTETMILSAEGN